MLHCINGLEAHYLTVQLWLAKCVVGGAMLLLPLESCTTAARLLL